MEVRRLVLDLAKCIEPFKSKKSHYDHMRAHATDSHEENLDIT